MTKILYIEDARSQRDIMKKVLELYGCDVTVADNGQEGLQKAHQVEPDVILLDVRMPIMDGHKTLQALKEDDSLSSIPVIAISAWGDKKTREAIMAAGAKSFLGKPIKYEQLIATIKKLTQSG